MSDAFTKVKSAPTTKPNDTVVKVGRTLKQEGVLLYRPEDNSFIALYPDEWLSCRADGYANKTAIDALQESNRAVTEKSLLLQHLLEQPNSAKADLAKARQDLDAAMVQLSATSDAAKERVKAIVSQKTDPNRLVELLPLTMKRIEGKAHTPIYVNAQKIQAALKDKRVYVVDGPAERKKPPEEKLFNGTTLNQKEMRKRFLNQVQDDAKFEKTWTLGPQDGDQYGAILTDWARVMGTSATAFLERGQKEIIDGVISAEKRDPKNPERMIDLKSEAQFMRWSAGAGAASTFMPFQGSLYDARDKNWGQRFKRAAKSAQFGIKANAEASFAVGEAKVETILFLPHVAGWHLNPIHVGQPFDFGFFRFRGDLTLSALAGASVAIEADAALMITGDKQGIIGTPRNQRGAKAKMGAKGEAQVFAGMKAGADLAGTLQWLNPEGAVTPSAPQKAVVGQQSSGYIDIASVGAGASGILGLSAKLGFECGYKQGHFVIAAKAGACLGLGGSGCVSAKVGVAQIGHFVMCVAHQLKQCDYKKVVDLMQQDVFDTLNQIFYLAVAANKTLESLVGKDMDVIEQLFEKVRDSVPFMGEQFIKQLEQQLRSGWGWSAYMPPESRGATIASIGNALKQTRLTGDVDLRNLAAFSVNELIATIQSPRHLHHTLDRITGAIGSQPGREQGVQLIEWIVEGTRFAGCLRRCELQVSTAAPLLGRPFLRNDEPDFQLARFPLHHPGYLIG